MPLVALQFLDRGFGLVTAAIDGVSIVRSRRDCAHSDAGLRMPGRVGKRIAECRGRAIGVALREPDESRGDARVDDELARINMTAVTGGDFLGERGERRVLTAPRGE